MKEHQRLKKLFEDHFDGDPWIEVQQWDTLQGLSAEDAAKAVFDLNSIWQIVHHMRCWRETMLKRVQGIAIPSPDDNYFKPVKDLSETAWKRELEELKNSQQALLTYLSSDIGNPDEKPIPGNYTKYELLQGLLQHDAYHLGQLILIKRLLRSVAAGQYISN